LLVAASLLTFVETASADDDVVAIVNDANSIKEITLQELRLVYSLYRRSWDDGVRVVLILPETKSPAMAFLTSEIFRGRGSQEIEDYYRTAAFQQRIAIQPRVASDRRAIAIVRSEPGAIALVSREWSIDHAGIEVLKIRRK
jgi:hypothetical protein